MTRHPMPTIGNIVEHMRSEHGVDPEALTESPMVLLAQHGYMHGAYDVDHEHGDLVRPGG